MTGNSYEVQDITGIKWITTLKLNNWLVSNGTRCCSAMEAYDIDSSLPLSSPRYELYVWWDELNFNLLQLPLSRRRQRGAVCKVRRRCERRSLVELSCDRCPSLALRRRLATSTVDRTWRHPTRAAPRDQATKLAPAPVVASRWIQVTKTVCVLVAL